MTHGQSLFCLTHSLLLDGLKAYADAGRRSSGYVRFFTITIRYLCIEWADFIVIANSRISLLHILINWNGMPFLLELENPQLSETSLHIQRLFLEPIDVSLNLNFLIFSNW